MPEQKEQRLVREESRAQSVEQVRGDLNREGKDYKVKDNKCTASQITQKPPGR